jgi:NAD(P)-dependent dehydrogenase (short-subunit alcohol dehydrogenase family)
MTVTWLITGANRGIGLDMARQALARGDEVIAGVRVPDQATALKALGGALTLVALDVADPPTIQAAAAQLECRKIDILVNNAGIIGPQRQSALDMDFDGFAQTLAVNTLGPLRVAQAFLPHLRRAKGARILTITSAMGSLAGSGADRMAYRTSKAAVNRLMQGLASDLKREGIAVAVAHPGWVRTDMGGSSADLSVQQSAGGLIGVCDKLSLAQTGRFLNWDGRELAW